MDKSLRVALKKWRLSHRYTLNEASKKIDVSQATYYNYENSESTPTYNNAEKVGKVLNVSASEIMDMSNFDMSMKFKD